MNKMILCVGLVLCAQAVVAGDRPKSLKDEMEANRHTLAVPKATSAGTLEKRTSKLQLYFIAEEDSNQQFLLDFQKFEGNASSRHAPQESEVRWEQEGAVVRTSIGRGYISDSPTKRSTNQKALVEEIKRQAQSFGEGNVVATFRSIGQLDTGSHEVQRFLITSEEFKNFFQAALAPVATKQTHSAVPYKTDGETKKLSETPRKSIVIEQPGPLTSEEPTSFFSNIYVKIGGAVTLAGALALIYYFRDYITSK